MFMVPTAKSVKITVLWYVRVLWYVNELTFWRKVMRCSETPMSPCSSSWHYMSQDDYFFVCVCCFGCGKKRNW